MAGAEEGSRSPSAPGQHIGLVPLCPSSGGVATPSRPPRVVYQLGLRPLPKAGPVKDRRKARPRRASTREAPLFGAARTNSAKWAAVEHCLTFSPPVVVL